jgi:hypothetical protein
MITVNNSIELLTASINEAYKENGEVWDKVLILRFPKDEFPFEEAVRLAEEAETVTNVTKDKIFEYSVTDIMDKKENPYFTEIWVNNPSVEVTDNLAEKLNEAEGKLTEAEEMLDIVTEGLLE